METSEFSLVEPGHFGDSKENIVILRNFIEPEDLRKVQEFLPTISEWENPKDDDFNDDGVCTYQADYWRDRMCSGRIIEKLDKDQAVFLYCGVGIRSAKAATILRKKGFKYVYDLDGGYKDLIKVGMRSVK